MALHSVDLAVLTKTTSVFGSGLTLTSGAKGFANLPYMAKLVVAMLYVRVIKSS